MTVKKLDFFITNGSEKQPVKVRVFRALDGSIHTNIHGDLFNDCEISINRLDQLISLLLEVRAAALVIGGCDDRTT